MQRPTQSEATPNPVGTRRVVVELPGSDARRPGRTGMRSESLRTANLSMVLQALHFNGSATRSQLVESTGLTRSSVAALVGDLVGAGLVTEGPTVRDGSPGRPSPGVSVAAGRAVLAIEVAVDSIAVAVVGLGGIVLDENRLERTRDRVSIDQTVGDISALTADARVRAGNPLLLGAGVAVAGIVRRDQNVVAMAPNLGWRHVRIADLLADACGLDVPFSVANDGDLGALAEARRGAAAGFDDMIYISGEVGVGGGIISGGAPILGRHGFAGEIGHLPINPDGTLCGCGSTGCWETEVGERAQLLRAGLDPDGGRSAVDDLIDRAATGEARALSAFDTTGRWLGIGIAGLVNLFNPGLVVMGGLFRRALPYVRESMRAELDVRTLDPSSGVDVVPSALGAAGPLIGAAELAFEPLLADPLVVAAAAGS